MTKIKLTVGLGNPGKEYEKTYHNVGFLFINYLNECRVLGVRRRALKSDVFMNQSGSFVRLALKKHKTKPEELLVVHDDSDIELGKYKISFSRGSAGHRGVQSVIDALKTKNFWRLRIGVRKAVGVKKTKAGDFVLKKITPADAKLLKLAFNESSKKIFENEN